MYLLPTVLLAFAAVTAKADPFPTAPYVYVEGSAEIRVEPDTLELSFNIEATDPQPATAKASVDERTRKLISACKELGIADDDISSASLQMGPAYEYRNEERQFLGTRVHRHIDVILRDLAKYPALIQALVASPIGEINSTTLSSSKGAKTLEQAQQLALADARARAERLATASGQELGPAYSISEFDHRAEQRYLLFPTREIAKKREEIYPASVSKFSAESEPFEPGMIVATATVYVIYLLEP